MVCERFAWKDYLACSVNRGIVMKVLITGASGFIGRHVVKALLGRGHSITAVDIDSQQAKKFDWFDSVNFVVCDIHQPILEPEILFGPADAVVHLAWHGLPNYKSLFHFEENLPSDYQFLKTLVLAGYKHLLVTGTCLEYGLQNGCLSESTKPRPSLPYSLAKDTLRKFLEALQKEHPFLLQWARLFYMYGEGQNPNSLLAQLDRAIERGDESFDMSGGEQLRDYLPVTKVATQLVTLMENMKVSGAINICSGIPISVRKLVENHIADRITNITLNPGHYPYTDHEPMAFWGDNTKMLGIIQRNN